MGRQRQPMTEPSHEWMLDAACRQPEHAGINFFPTRGESATPAKAVCAECGVIGECREYVTVVITDIGRERDFSGIWAGMSGKERMRIRKARRRGLTVP